MGGVGWAASRCSCRCSRASSGCPTTGTARYDPLFAAIQETGLPICCHIGLNTQLDDLARRDPTPQKGIFVPMVALSAAEALGMWVMGGVFERFPRLKVVFVEPGLGWVSWWLYIVDDMMTRQGYEFPAITELPSHYFRQNMYLTFIDEPDAIRTCARAPRRREHHVVDRLPAPGVELAELAVDGRRDVRGRHAAGARARGERQRGTGLGALNPTTLHDACPTTGDG